MLKITCLGSRARKILEKSKLGSIWGSTSQGVFLHFPPRDIVFLSYGAYRGPLTANLTGEEVLLRKISVGEQVHVELEEIIFPHPGIRLGWHTAPIWDAPLLPKEEINLPMILKRHQEVSRRVRTSQDILSVERSLRAKRSNLNLSGDLLLSILIPLLGKGPGLTPAGDDFILGFLLTLSRWGSVINPALDTQGLRQELVSQAYRYTTLLSANLIECASEGQADERLVLTLDGVVSGNLSVELCAEMVLNWGDSSGRAAFTGMGTAIKSL